MAGWVTELRAGRDQANSNQCTNNITWCHSAEKSMSCTFPLCFDLKLCRHCIKKVSLVKRSLIPMFYPCWDWTGCHFRMTLFHLLFFLGWAREMYATWLNKVTRIWRTSSIRGSVLSIMVWSSDLHFQSCHKLRMVLNIYIRTISHTVIYGA